MKSSKVHRLALREIRETILAYQRLDDPTLGDDIRIRIRTALFEIKSNPLRFSRWNGTQVRKYILRRFPYIIFYMDYPEFVRILAVAHTSRRPGYWTKRIARVS